MASESKYGTGKSRCWFIVIQSPEVIHCEAPPKRPHSYTTWKLVESPGRHKYLQVLVYYTNPRTRPTDDWPEAEEILRVHSFSTAISIVDMEDGWLSHGKRPKTTKRRDPEEKREQSIETMKRIQGEGETRYTLILQFLREVELAEARIREALSELRRMKRLGILRLNQIDARDPATLENQMTKLKLEIKKIESTKSKK